LIPVLASMEEAGIKLDQSFFEQFFTLNWKNAWVKLKKKFNRHPPGMNLTSTPHNSFLKLLFDKLGLDTT
jgi:DNA polymerase I-like protein with 3'-5' exonuclease and polymerase domains